MLLILSLSDLMQPEYSLRVMLVLMMMIVLLLLVLLVKKKETTIDCEGAGMRRRWYMVYEEPASHNTFSLQPSLRFQEPIFSKSIP